MDRQELQNAFAEFLKSEQGGALVTETLSTHFERNDVILFNPKERLSESGSAVFLTRDQIFERAMDFSTQHNEGVDFWVNSIQRAIKEVNKAQPEPGP